MNDERDAYRILTKLELMQQLHIEPNQLVTRNHTVTEKLFCCALLDAGSVVTAQVLAKYHILRDILEDKL